MSNPLYSRVNKVYFRSYLLFNIVASSAYIISFYLFTLSLSVSKSAPLSLYCLFLSKRLLATCPQTERHSWHLSCLFSGLQFFQPTLSISHKLTCTDTIINCIFYMRRLSIILVNLHYHSSEFKKRKLIAVFYYSLFINVVFCLRYTKIAKLFYSNIFSTIHIYHDFITRLKFSDTCDISLLRMEIQESEQKAIFCRIDP